jgi:hypothetical protein
MIGNKLIKERSGGTYTLHNTLPPEVLELAEYPPSTGTPKPEKNDDPDAPADVMRL